MVGKGWHLESQRHSTARRFGSAGGKMPKKFKPVAYSPPYKPMKFKKEIEVKPFVIKDGDEWSVLYANETKSKQFNTRKEAQEFKESLLIPKKTKKDKEIILSNGLLKSSKDVEFFKGYVLVHDFTDGWKTYNVPNDIYKKYSSNKISYWDMIDDKRVKEE